MDFTRRLIQDGLVALIVFGGPATGVFMLGVLQSVDWYVLAFFTLATPGVVFWSYLQVKVFWTTRRQTIERSRDIIRQWLDQTRLDVSNNPNDDPYWRFTVKQSGHAVSIYRPKQDPDLIYFGIDLVLPQHLCDGLAKLSQNVTSDLVGDLKIEIARLGLQYRNLSVPLVKFGISTQMAFSPDTTRPDFLERMGSILRVQVIISVLIERTVQAHGLSLAGPNATQPVPDMVVSQPPTAC